MQILTAFNGPLGRFHVNLGAALYEMRDFVGAIRAFEAALGLDADDVTARLNLANALSEVMLYLLLAIAAARYSCC